MPQTDIEIGDYVECRISGAEGIVVTIGDHITGCTRIGVRPDPERDSREDEKFFYDGELNVTGANYRTNFDLGYDVQTETDFTIGERVKDDITGFEGVITVINYKLFNCPCARVQSVDDVDEGHWIDVPRLESVDEGVSEDYGFLQEEDGGSTGPVEDSPSRSLKKTE